MALNYSIENPYTTPESWSGIIACSGEFDLRIVTMINYAPGVRDTALATILPGSHTHVHSIQVPYKDVFLNFSLFHAHEEPYIGGETDVAEPSSHYMLICETDSDPHIMFAAKSAVMSGGGAVQTGKKGAAQAVEWFEPVWHDTLAAISANDSAALMDSPATKAMGWLLMSEQPLGTRYTPVPRQVKISATGGESFVSLDPFPKTVAIEAQPLDVVKCTFTALNTIYTAYPRHMQITHEPAVGASVVVSLPSYDSEAAHVQCTTDSEGSCTLSFSPRTPLAIP